VPGERHCPARARGLGAAQVDEAGVERDVFEAGGFAFGPARARGEDERDPGGTVWSEFGQQYERVGLGEERVRGL
jgi:hypothetical protein